MARRNKADFDAEAFADRVGGKSPINLPELSPEARGKTPGQAKVRAVEFMDGPAQGKIHEIAACWPVPDRIGQKDASDPTLVHCYRVVGDKGYLDYSEREL